MDVFKFLRNNDISNQQIGLYIFIIIVTLVLFTRVIDINLGHVFALFISIIVITLFSLSYKQDTTEFNKDMEYKLNYLDNDKSLTNYFYLDVNLISLFYNIKTNYYTYNPISYQNALSSVNEVLKVRNDMEKDICSYSKSGSILDNDILNINSSLVNDEVYTCGKILNNSYENYQIADENTKEALNYLESIFISIPPNENLETNFQRIVDRAQLLLKRNMDIIVSRIKQHEKELDYSKHIITDYDDTKPINSLISKRQNANFNFF